MANRGTEPESVREHYGQDFIDNEKNKLFALLAEMKTKLDALRVDMRSHDHGAAYGAAATRLNGSPNTFSGTAETSAATTTTAPKKHIG